jgi:hypothetical protein
LGIERGSTGGGEETKEGNGDEYDQSTIYTYMKMF